MSDSNPKPFLTTSDVCREFGVSRSTLLRLRRAGKIGGERFGREIVFPRRRIEAYLAGEKEMAAARPSADLPKVPSTI